MPTHLLHPAKLLALLPLITTVLSAGVAFQCNGQRDHMFHQDCATAANELVLSLTREDGRVHIPNDDVMHSYMNCEATLEATGGEKIDQGSAILLSFAQIGARCQEGSFTYPSNTIKGNLKGAANWKREGPSIKRVKRALSAPLRFLRREMQDTIAPQQLGQLQRRSDMMAARKGYNGQTYRLMLDSAHGVPELSPTSPDVSSMFFQRSREQLQHHFTKEDTSDLVFGNAYPIKGGTHVSVITLGVKLRGSQTSWKEFVQSQNDSGKTIKELITDGLSMFTSNQYVAAYFHVLDGNNRQVFSFMIYGYDSVDSPLPA
ncbi:hypothetical protein H072_6904 [Dactylellina haptotyla CBS 200.50]|uniref:Uncharacterized protein n=1 Tax=Dactylellina haptotyla (strain CBS 200.50) TaxID=1284197 RepID=S8A8I0_DACHA|nr:hypothetical protein H072_6904 [Dactylellina haptotyla CBS 200.50]